MQLEEMKDELQQIEDQNEQTWKTQFERDLAAKEKVREGKRHGIAKQLRDIKTEMDEVREQKQAEQRTNMEEREDKPQQTKDQFRRDLAAKEKVREEDLAHIEIMVEDVTHSKTKRRIGQIAQKAGNVSIKKYGESYILKEQGGLKGYI